MKNGNGTKKVNNNESVSSKWGSKQENSSMFPVLIRLTAYVQKYCLAVTGAIIAILVSTGLGLIPPWLVRYGIDNYISNNSSDYLWVIGAAMVGITLFQGLIDYIKKYITEYISQNIIHDIRVQLYAHLNRLSFAFFDHSRIGDIMSRVTADADTLRGFLANASVFISSNVLTILGILVIMISWDYRLAVLYLLMIPLMVFGMYQYSTGVRPLYRKVRKKFAHLNTIIQEDILGIEVIKLFAGEEKEQAEFKKANQQYTNFNIHAAKVSAFWMPYVNFFMGMGTALVIWYGGRLVISGTISIGVLVGFTSYIAMLLRPIRQTGMMINYSNQAVAAAERIFQILDTDSAIKDSPEALELPPLQGMVEFRNVSFSYQNEKRVLKNIDLQVDAGQTVAVVGPTGAGKSTLIHLLPRFYDPDQGQILIDNNDISKVEVDSLRKQVGIVLQDTYLFAASIKENISYGKPDAAMEEIVEAAKVAQIHNFIQGLPLGYETPVGERGVSLSGGQRQRLAMARVLLTDPRLLILDEPTSSVDAETEEKMQQALAAVIKGRTTFIIAHRLWTVRNADKIIVIKDGRIVEEGTHRELISKGGFYSQVNAKDLTVSQDSNSKGGEVQ
ncbi:MAG: ABC transporter ATP-binding protein [Halanaerobiales bacterium]